MKALVGLASGFSPLLFFIYLTGGIFVIRSFFQLLLCLFITLGWPILLYFFSQKREMPYFAGGAISAILPNLIIFCLALAVSMFTNY